ncbi:cytochrome c [Microbaculum marinisediminis]|uniref:Cytochrome c n=1 Tax=Microbaculum marinisediminis TaxID=2931392 RepID=A0AAW5R248_9HYPH|nr:cytochrome c [Microbaculum sp. A6E488]MCT8973420.1 cytochrome c [Microbaculum sp. A6E488]
MLNRRLIVPFLLVLLVLVPGASATAAAGDPVNGRLVVERWCSLCHSVNGVNTDPDRAPTFEQIANRDGRDRAYLSRMVHEDHFPMTTFRLFEDEKRDVVAFILSLSRN